MKIKTLFCTILLLMCMQISVYATVASSSIIYDGIDVSQWQGNIDFSRVKNDGIDIVYIKSSQGTGFIDPYFRINYNNSKANDLKVGFYHFLTARNQEEAIAQADFFASCISNTNPDCKLAMDFEVFDGLSVEEINNISQVFLQRVQEITGKEVIIYSDLSNARNTFNSELASKYPLWIAEYGVENPSETNWELWQGFQYTSQGRVDGIEDFVDRDKFTQDIFLSNTNSIVESGNKENYTRDEFYIVQKCDTLSSIAIKYGTTVQELVELNNITNPNLIFPGEKLIVPIKNDNNGEQIYDSGHIIYTVKAGDTLSEIALKYDTTVQSIAQLNDINNVNLIFTGEQLRIDI